MIAASWNKIARRTWYVPRSSSLRVFPCAWTSSCPLLKREVRARLVIAFPTRSACCTYVTPDLTDEVGTLDNFCVWACFRLKIRSISTTFMINKDDKVAQVTEKRGSFPLVCTLLDVIDVNVAHVVV